MSSHGKERIDVIATTISGSVADWGKTNRIEGEFRKHHAGPLGVHVVDTHSEARRRTAELVNLGSRTIVSAGGAGTFNSILEGCCTPEGIPGDLRLAFLRKGSADLIGKALGVPDDLGQAARAIYESIEKRNFISADVIEISGENTEKRHFLGFSGVGVFGDAPRFTENRFTKYYKGLLGTLFGDLGPFMVGVNCALMKHHVDNLKGGVFRFHPSAEDVDLPMERYVSIIILNGDLSKDFPLATGMPFGSGDFKVVTIRDKGLALSYKQLVSCWRGDVFRHAKELGVESFKTSRLKITPEDVRPYMVNVDGLILWARGPIHYSICDQVKLVSGK